MTTKQHNESNQFLPRINETEQLLIRVKWEKLIKKLTAAGWAPDQVERIMGRIAESGQMPKWGP